jgi:HNH endonuclease
MTQDQVIILCFKVGEVAALVTIVAFIACYSRWAAWWQNAVGRTIVIKDLLLIIVFIPTLLSLFFNFSRLTSRIAAWSDIAMIALISPVMIWRIVVFWKIHKKGRRGGPDTENNGDSTHSSLYCSVDISAPAVLLRHHRGARPGERSSMTKRTRSRFTCSVEGCSTPVEAREWCKKHYQKWLRYGDPLAVRRPARDTCTIEGCDEPHRSRGYCDKHYQRWKKWDNPLAPFIGPLWPETCRVEDCGRKANEPGGARGYCQKHYVHWRKHGDPVASASCSGCGAPIMVGKGSYCMRRECRRLFRVAQRAKDPERHRAMQAAKRKRADKAKKRAAEKRYKARTDRKCCRPGCPEFALPTVALCREHRREQYARRYARKRLRLPRRLYIRQVGLCPDAAHGGCGLPLGDPDGNHVDHLIPEVRNGPDDEWNLQLMHPECNMRKSDSLVPAARIAAKQHGVMLARPGGGRPRGKAA